MNQRKRIISMALTLIVLFSVMAMSVYAATSYEIVDVYHYGGTRYSAKYSGSSAEASCRNWASSSGNIHTYIIGYESGSERTLAYVLVTPGNELPLVAADGSVDEIRLKLTPTTTTTRGEAVIFVYSD